MAGFVVEVHMQGVDLGRIDVIRHIDTVLHTGRDHNELTRGDPPLMVTHPAVQRSLGQNIEEIAGDRPVCLDALQVPVVPPEENAQRQKRKPTDDLANRLTLCRR